MMGFMAGLLVVLCLIRGDVAAIRHLIGNSPADE